MSSAPRFHILPYYLVPALLLCLLVRAAYPYYGYYVDPDAVSYLTLVDRYVAGDYAQAVNAFWSPMGVWLTVLLVKWSGWQHFAAALVVNTAAALSLLLAAQSLFHRFRADHRERLVFGMMSAVFWATTVYRQSFTDLWQCFFLLLSLLILLKKDFLSKAYWWLILGAMGALAYFSKAFSFYFLPLMTAVAVWIRMKHDGRVKWSRMITILVVTGGTMIVCAFPWLYALHEKYGGWINSTAGRMNLGWWVMGHPDFKYGIRILVPPAPYPHSLFYFEDPPLAEKPPVAFWSSPYYFLKQLFRIAYNVLDWVRCSNQISPFYFVTWLCTIVVLMSKKARQAMSFQLRIIATILLIFPLPYALMTFDQGRYLWFTIPLSVVIGLYFFDIFLKDKISSAAKMLFTMIYFFSFLPVTLLEMKNIYRVGEEDYKIAQALNQLNIHGSFFMNDYVTSETGQSCLRIAYWTQNPFYSYGENVWTTQQLLEDAKRLRVKYYFYRYAGSGDDYVLKDTVGNPYPELTGGKVAGIKVFLVDR